jgi:hypothetical protein
MNPEPLNGYLLFYIPYYLDHVKLDSRFFKEVKERTIKLEQINVFFAVFFVARRSHNPLCSLLAP